MLSIGCNSCIKSEINRRNIRKVISKIESFIKKHNLKGINHPPGKDDRKSLEKNNPTTAINILYVKNGKTYPVYVSKHNSMCEKQALLIISNREGWNYLAIT